MTTQPYTASADDWALHLARFVATLRPDWQIPGIRAAIHGARNHGDRPDIATALIDLSRRDDIRTPAMLADDGPWWHTGRTPDARVKPARCTEPGHEHELAAHCRACRSELIGADATTDTTRAWTPDQAARNAQGAARARDAIDRARRAAGERDEE